MSGDSRGTPKPRVIVVDENGLGPDGRRVYVVSREFIESLQRTAKACEVIKRAIREHFEEEAQ